MEQSPLGSTTSEPEKINGTVNDHKPRQDKAADQQLVADQLLAALASGNLDHLAQAREAYLKQSTETPREAPQTKPITEPPATARTRPADFEEQIERPTTPRQAERA